MASASTTPLLLLLDSVLSQDREQLDIAMQLVRRLLKRDIPGILSTTLPEIVKQLLASNPELAFIPSDHDRSLPLSFAASIGDIAVAELLINVNPQAVSAPNDKGKIPLHYAAREGRTEMVLYLLRVHPLTACIPTKKDKLAIHFASGEGHLGVVQALLRVHPDGASMPSKKGKLPLHFAARWGHLSVAQLLLTLFPEGIYAVDWDGSNPLHDAARESQAVMSQFLIDRWPGALQATSLRGEIPLFSAVRSGNLNFVACLLKAWHQGGKHVLQNITDDDAIQDWDWNILELCLRGAESNFNGCSLLNVKTVCESGHRPLPPINKTVERREDKKRALVSFSLSKKRLRAKEDTITECPCLFYPVHAALRADVNSRLLRVVMEKSGQDLTVADSFGAHPIHVAVSHVTSKDAVQVCIEEILKRHPESARVFDSASQLPLHRALESNADFAFIKALVEMYPKSAIEKFMTRGPNSVLRSPIEVALERDSDLSTIFFLLQHDPNFVKQNTCISA